MRPLRLPSSAPPSSGRAPVDAQRAGEVDEHPRRPGHGAMLPAGGPRGKAPVLVAPECFRAPGVRQNPPSERNTWSGQRTSRGPGRRRPPPGPSGSTVSGGGGGLRRIEIDSDRGEHAQRAGARTRPGRRCR